MRWILLALWAGTSCGCAAVVANRPVGETPLDLSSRTEEWSGTWRSPMGPCTLSVVDATNGVLAMTSTQPKGWWRWSNETQRVYLRSGGEWTYASVDYTEGTNACFLWGKVANEDGLILWWLPDPDKIRPLVETGTLPGNLEKTIKKKKTEPPSEDEPADAASGEDFPLAVTDISALKAMPDMLDGELIILGDLKAEHYELLAATSNGVMFLWEAPLVLIKKSARTDLRTLRATQKQWMREQGK